MIQVPSAIDRLVVMGDFEGLSPDELFDHWVDPVLLVNWWPKLATTEPMFGGRYRFEWPQAGHVLSGQYNSYMKGSHLGFTWTWDHEPGLMQQVDVFFQPLLEGTRIGIHHGRFDPDQVVLRQGVAEGWIHFGMLLAGLRPGTSL